MQNTIALKKLEDALKQIIPKLPTMLGAEAVRFSKESWRRQGWLDNSLDVWGKRKSKKDPGRAILMKSGRLRRSIRVLRNTPDSVIIGTDVPYAAAHNDGFSGKVSVRAHQRNKYHKARKSTGKYNKNGKERVRTVTSTSGSKTIKAHTRTMRIPKRQFLGDSATMKNQMKQLITSEILNTIKNL